jgi:hypothetical protein
MAIRLGRSLPNASRDLPGRRRENTPAGRNPTCRPYSVLLPVWFTLPPPLPAARCALTAPFHPYPPAPTRLRRAVYFLWHFPWGCPRRALPGTVFPWSPDFPPPARFPRCERRPSDRLALDMWRYSRLRSRNSGAGTEKGKGFCIQRAVHKRRSETALEGGKQDGGRGVWIIANPGQQ